MNISEEDFKNNTRVIMSKFEQKWKEDKQQYNTNK